MKSKKSNLGEKKQSLSTTSLKNYKVYPTDIFMAEAKKLAKKFPTIKQDFEELHRVLKKDPITGNDNLGRDCYKVRMPITDKNCGQSGGARVIIEVKIIDKKVYLLSVYNKGDKSTILEKEIDECLKKRLEQYK
jgi:hypothetical protein